MGRSILAEDYVQIYVDSIINEKRWNVGIIVGQLTNQKDYVVHMVKTPRDDGSQEDQSLLELDDNWVAKHARQVESMLPGGLSAIGIFAVAPPDVLKKAEHKLRQVLFATCKLLRKSSALLGNDEAAVSHRLLLQICAVTRKLTCRTFDTSDNNSSARPADWKYQSFVERWLSLSSHVSTDVVIPVTINMGSKSLKREIQIGLQGTCDNVRNSLALLNKQMYADEDLLDTSQSSKKKRHKDDPATRHYDVSLFTQTTKTASKDPVCSECCAKMLLRGTVACKAYVNNKATAKEAITALKNDFVRTLIQRCDLLCEDLLSAEEEQDPKIVYETPRRVFTTLPGSRIDVCDYVFVDETSVESRERFRELLGIDVTEGDIDMECETLPTEEDLIKPSISSDVTDKGSASSISDSRKSTSIPIVGVVTASLVAVAASILSYVYLSDTIP